MSETNHAGPGVNAELAARMPWIVAEPGSFWSVSSLDVFGIPGTALRHSLAVVLPGNPATPGRLATFLLLEPHTRWPGGPATITADLITHAYRLLLVHADDPRIAYYLRDQNLLEQE